MRKILTAIALFALAACAENPGPSLYLLEAPAPDAVRGAQTETVGVREVALPLYARRQQIAHQDIETGALTISDDNRWAEEPPKATTRLIARRLSELRGAPAYDDPWPQGATPELIVSVEVDRFLGKPGGEVLLDGQYTIVRSSARNRAETRPFAISTTVAGTGYDALTAAYGVALGELSDQIAVALSAY